MIVLFTDFGSADPYAGQMRASILRAGAARAGVPVVDLLHHAPNFNIRVGAYLLDALQGQFEAGDVFVCVVDPGVGGDRAPVMVQADGKWYVGPDNGLFNVVCRRASTVTTRRIDWRPGSLSPTFHGRDLFAPVAAGLAAGEKVASSACELMDTGDWPGELAQIVYIDHYGNAMTGWRATTLSDSAVVRAAGRRLDSRRTFLEGRAGEPFWYRNSVGLVEIAVKENSAAGVLGLEVGDRIEVTDHEALLDDPAI